MRQHKIYDLFDVRKQTGEVGIEIEMEGTRLGDTHNQGVAQNGKLFPWEYKMDGSLRGESCEWVLQKPIPRDQVSGALNMLWTAKAAVNGKFDPSKRCGVHVHMNVQDLTEEQVWNLVATYIAFEPLLLRWVGEDREGNLFCLRAADARELIDRLAYARQEGSFNPIFSDEIRYASVNINALYRYGSVEFRALGTPTAPSRINQWVKLLWAVREFSLEMLPQNLLMAMSGEGEGIIPRAFGAKSPLRLIPGREKLLREGMRNLQDLLLTQSERHHNRGANLPGDGGFWIPGARPMGHGRYALQPAVDELVREFEDDLPEPGDDYRDIEEDDDEA